ncbi:MAG: 2Fe-2S iron-sulfur cluster-binding protein [Bacteroidia bacterium]|nr:2Fe-2S iron-sulfur cluster-binding protein [Bacteroidia bacterium]
MVKLKINNTDYEAPEELTILDVAKSAGFNIPTLCHKEGLPHYSSCMVCMVKDNKTNSFVPSCAALVQEGMDIDISGEEVISLRCKAIELLLSEHRAECEAPCKVVCPAGYNIPLMNRLITAKDFDAAVKLSLSEHGLSEILCAKCPGYCENACRRKKVDIPVSIRNMQLFISQRINQNKPVQDVADQHHNNDIVIETGPKKRKLSKLFTSHIGRLEETELLEWLKECSGKGIRFREISDFNSAAGEAESCMHCDCRAADNCRLKDLAEEFSIKDPRGKLVNSPIVKKINHNTGLIFENAKCIKCGLCVRLCEDLKEEPALCFIRRGFVSIISEPLTEEFDNILKTKSKEVIEICPTGALSQLK